MATDALNSMTYVHAEENSTTQKTVGEITSNYFCMTGWLQQLYNHNS